MVMLCVGDGVMRSFMSSSVVWCLVPAPIDISLRPCGELIVPPHLNAVLMAAWDNWQIAVCLLMNCYEFSNHLQYGCKIMANHLVFMHRWAAASLYLCARLPLFSRPYIKFNVFMSSFGDLWMKEWMAVPAMFVRFPWGFALRMTRFYRELWCGIRSELSGGVG